MTFQTHAEVRESQTFVPALYLWTCGERLLRPVAWIWLRWSAGGALRNCRTGQHGQTAVQNLVQTEFRPHTYVTCIPLSSWLLLPLSCCSRSASEALENSVRLKRKVKRGLPPFDPHIPLGFYTSFFTTTLFAWGCLLWSTFSSQWHFQSYCSLFGILIPFGVQPIFPWWILKPW